MNAGWKKRREETRKGSQDCCAHFEISLTCAKNIPLLLQIPSFLSVAYDACVVGLRNLQQKDSWLTTNNGRTHFILCSYFLTFVWVFMAVIYFLGSKTAVSPGFYEINKTSISQWKLVWIKNHFYYGEFIFYNKIVDLALLQAFCKRGTKCFMHNDMLFI